MPRNKSFGRQCYEDIAVELGGGLTVDDMSDEVVIAAKDYAEKNKKRWPPKPVGPDLNSQIIGQMLLGKKFDGEKLK